MVGRAEPGHCRAHIHRPELASVPDEGCLPQTASPELVLSLEFSGKGVVGSGKTSGGWFTTSEAIRGKSFDDSVNPEHFTAAGPAR